MKRLKLAPIDFGLHIRRHPNVVIEEAVREMRSRQGLDVTAPNKSKSAQTITLKLSLGNRIMETVRFLNTKDSQQHNHRLVEEFFQNMENNHKDKRYSPEGYPDLFVEIKSTKDILGYIGVPNEPIQKFITEFNLPEQKLSSTSAKLPLRFLLQFLKQKNNEKLSWDVSLVTGGDRSLVKINGLSYKRVGRSVESASDKDVIKLPKNQLSIPAHEYRFLSGSYNDIENRTTARKLRKKPLLLIYPINPKAIEAEKDTLDLTMFKTDVLWGWSISMPGNEHDADYISVLANKKFLQELEKDYKDDFENEDY
jgi:hypothetical protein